MSNITAGARERADVNRTTEVGYLEESLFHFHISYFILHPLYLPRSGVPICAFAELRRGRGEFLKARIIPQRIEHRIESEQRRSEGDVRSQRAFIR